MPEKTYYIGKDKVKNYVVAENINLVSVLYENGKSEDLTNEQWVEIRSEEEYESGLISIKKHSKLMQRILQEMMDSRVTMLEFEWLLHQIGTSTTENYNRAVAKVFGVPYTEKIMLTQIHETLKK